MLLSIAFLIDLSLFFIEGKPADFTDKNTVTKFMQQVTTFKTFDLFQPYQENNSSSSWHFIFKSK